MNRRTITSPPSASLLPALLVALLLALAVPGAEFLRPTIRTADRQRPVDLANEVPRQFADWREDLAVRPILPDPALQATLDLSYSQVLARTYVDSAGRRVMLSIAYGNDQSSQATAVHAPEFCYRSQGFEVTVLSVRDLTLGAQVLQVQGLVGRMGPRVEPITYWVTLDEQATLPGWGRKWQQLRYGLGGLIADGMVVRVSTIGTPGTPANELHAQFLREWYAAMPPGLRARYFGTSTPR